MKEYTINPITREIKPVRKDAALGVYSDNGTDGAFFTLTGDIVRELTTYNSRVNFINFGEENVEVGDITDVNISGDTLTCSWILDRRATNSVGQIVFNLCFTKADGKEWNTTVCKDKILEGLEPTLTEEEEQRLGSYYDMLVKQLDEEADRKKQEVLASIPADYTELQNQVSRQNESIVDIQQNLKPVEFVEDEDESIIVNGTVVGGGGGGSDWTEVQIRALITGYGYQTAQQVSSAIDSKLTPLESLSAEILGVI